MSLSNYAEQKLLAHLLGISAFTFPTNMYVALFTDDPGEDGSGTEVSGGSYARASVTFLATGTSSTTNNSAATFPTPTASWGTVTHWAIFDAAAGGNMLVYGALATPRDIGVGQDTDFEIGALVVDFGSA